MQSGSRILLKFQLKVSFTLDPGVDPESGIHLGPEFFDSGSGISSSRNSFSGFGVWIALALDYLFRTERIHGLDPKCTNFNKECPSCLDQKMDPNSANPSQRYCLTE